MCELKSGDIGLTRNGKIVHLRERQREESTVSSIYPMFGVLKGKTAFWTPKGHWFEDGSLSDDDIVAVAVPLTPYNKPSLGKYLTATGNVVSPDAFYETGQAAFIFGAGIGADARVTHKFVPLEDLPDEEPVKDEFHITGPGRYETRGGAVAIVEGEHDNPPWVWKGRIGNDFRTWGAEGQYGSNGTHVRDLIKRLPDEPANEEFRITGPGRYATRDGRSAIVEAARDDFKYPWRGTLEGVQAWTDRGFYFEGEGKNGLDLVKRLPDGEKPSQAEAALKVHEVGDAPSTLPPLDLTKECKTEDGDSAKHVHTFADGRLLFICTSKENGAERTFTTNPDGTGLVFPSMRSMRIVNVTKRVVQYALVLKADGKDPITLGRYPLGTKEDAGNAADVIGRENIRAIARLEWEE